MQLQSTTSSEVVQQVVEEEVDEEGQLAQEQVAVREFYNNRNNWWRPLQTSENSAVLAYG